MMSHSHMSRPRTQLGVFKEILFKQILPRVKEFFLFFFWLVFLLVFLLFFSKRIRTTLGGVRANSTSKKNSVK